MQVHAFAMAARGIGPDHPIDHDVSAELLPEALSIIASAAIKAGHLSCYIALNGGRWVSRAQLAAVAGFGRKLYDERDPCFVPAEAMLIVPYLSNPVTQAIAAASPYQRQVLSTARLTADYLAALRAAMPPRPHDVHVHETSNNASSLLPLIRLERINTHRSSCGWWLIGDEVRRFLPSGDSLDDPASAWYVDVHDRADHDEVDRLIAEHRRYWPEIYGEFARPSRQAASLQTAQ